MRSGIGYENRWGLQTYAPLLALPNVQEFYAGQYTHVRLMYDASENKHNELSYQEIEHYR